MKKLSISLMAIAMCMPALADNVTPNIAPGTNPAACTQPVLGTTSGTSNLEAGWTPNTLNIDWYNGETKLTSNTCTYDSGVTVPANNPSKTGYTFDGWTVRIVNNPFANLDVNVSTPFYNYSRKLNGSGCFRTYRSGYWGTSTQESQDCSASIYDDLENAGEWKAVFSYGAVYGTSMCSGSTADENVSGSYCWCKLSGYTPNNGSMQTASGTKWFYVNSFSNNSGCLSGCANWCGTKLGDEKTIRLKQYGQSQTVDDCSTITDSASCSKSFQKGYNELCKWSYSQCNNYKVSSCSMLNNEGACSVTRETASNYSCLWLNSECRSRKVDDCSTITDETLCEASINDGDNCRWINGGCYGVYVDDCSEIEDADVCNASREGSITGCEWTGDGCESYLDD